MDGELYTVIEFQHVKPGKGNAFVRTKLKSVKTGAVLDKTFRAGEKFEQARLETKKMQFLYQEGDLFHFMDTDTYEQLPIQKSKIGEALNFIKENSLLEVEFYEGEPINVKPPIFVELKVEKTEPGVKGDTATGGSKPAVLETGYTVQVPLFINVGDTVKIDTRTGEYITRV
jgi:elongation factor P